MGTFAAGHMLDPRTGRPVAAQVVQVLEYPTDVPVVPDGGSLATGARGGYARFVVPDVDTVTLAASDGTRVDLVSIEAQEAAAAAGPFLESAEARLTALESDSGTSGPGETIQVGGTQPASGWWLDNGTTGTPVTANVPTADDTANTITWTPKTGVQYVIGGTVRTPPYSVGDVTTSVTVTAQATSGYTLTGTSSWTFDFTGSAPADTTPPTGATLAVTGSGIAGSTRTLTVTGAADPGSGLHATPYAFSTNGGSTYSTYQASNVFTTGALAAGTYQPRARVRDAAATPNVATVSAADFTVAAAPASGFSDDFNRADTTAPGLGAAWTDPSSMFYISSNTARANATANAKALADAGLTDVQVSVEITGDGAINPGPGNYGVVARAHATDETFYHGRHSLSGVNGLFQIYRFVGGVATKLGTDYVYNWGGTETVTLVLRVKEGTGQTDLTLIVNGTPRITTSDTDASRPLTGTHVGLRTNTTYRTFDNFAATAAP